MLKKYDLKLDTNFKVVDSNYIETYQVLREITAILNANSTNQRSRILLENGHNNRFHITIEKKIKENAKRKDYNFICLGENRKPDIFQEDVATRQLGSCISDNIKMRIQEHSNGILKPVTIFNNCWFDGTRIMQYRKYSSLNSNFFNNKFEYLEINNSQLVDFKYNYKGYLSNWHKDYKENYYDQSLNPNALILYTTFDFSIEKKLEHKDIEVLKNEMEYLFGFLNTME